MSHFSSKVDTQGSRTLEPNGGCPESLTPADFQGSTTDVQPEAWHLGTQEKPEGLGGKGLRMGQGLFGWVPPLAAKGGAEPSSSPRVPPGCLTCCGRPQPRHRGVSPSWSQCALHCSPLMGAAATSFLRSLGYFHLLRVTLKWLGAGAWWWHYAAMYAPSSMVQARHCAWQRACPSVVGC